jgi:anti-sigma factor RsiW
MSPDTKLFRCGKEGEACRQTSEVAAYLMGELNASEWRAFEAHLAACPTCVRELESARRTLGALKTVGPAGVTRDLAPSILARLEVGLSRTRRTSPLRRVYAAAAALLLLLGGAMGFWALHRPSPKSEVAATVTSTHQLTASACSEALVWLCRTQEPDGSWNAEAWGGDQRFGVALSSLAVLALLGSEPISMERTAAVRKAVGYLVKQQRATGEFGPSFSSTPYNHGITTLALLRAYHVLHDESLRPPLDRAVAVIREHQAPQGGWGYWGEGTREPNLSVTLWQIEALKLAVSLGWDGARPSVQRAVQWVASVADDRGFFGYRRADDFPSGPQTLTAIGAMAVLKRS